MAGPEVIVNTLTQSVIEHHFTVGATASTRCGEWSVAYLHELFHNAALIDEEADRYYKLKTEQKVVQLAWGYRY